MSDVSQGPGWWLASDGKWYPPTATPAGPPPRRYCRHCGMEVSPQAVVCLSCGGQPAGGRNYCGQCGTGLNPGAAVCLACGASALGGAHLTLSLGTERSKLVAGLLGIFLGGLGIHRFYTGHTSQAVTMLLISVVGGILTCGVASLVVSVWGLIEGILMLTGSIATDADGRPLV